MQKIVRGKRVVFGLFALVLAMGICSASAFAAPSSSENETNVEETQNTLLNEVSGNAQETDVLTTDETANSWRYTDGILDSAKAKASFEAEDYTETDEDLVAPLAYAAGAWRKNSDGKYVSVDGVTVVDRAIGKGVDVSEHNGTIDWAAAKDDGIDFAIIRVGRIIHSSNDARLDYQFERNASECERVGVPYGIYIYSYATNTDQASREADFVIEALRGYDVSLPVYYDLEESSLESTSNRSLLASLASTFCNKVKDAGYDVGVYANLNWWNNYLTDSVFDQWDRWVAQWPATTSSEQRKKCEYTGTLRIWQCAGDEYGLVNGITTATDLDLLMDYPFGADPNAWYVTEGAYDYVTSNGLITGYSSINWGGNDSLTRGQLATILWRMSGKPIVEGAQSFDDVNYSEYYGDAINWARSVGVITGYYDDGQYRTFGPEDAVSRQDFATMLARYASNVNGYNTWSNCEALDAKVDSDQVADYARESMGWAVDKGIINGQGGVYLAPYTNASRAEAASMVYRYCTTPL